MPAQTVEAKKSGHQDAATFANKMSGSTAICVVINDQQLS